MGESSDITLRVRYEGRVQGVGFRQTTAQLAVPLAVVGSVQNMPDGEVELFVQGATSEVHHLLTAIRREFAANLVNEHAEDAPSLQTSSFRILY